MKIKKITLSGFQVFKEPTEIPLEKITLLYGPNSSGKSAIEDAYQLIEAISSAYHNGEIYRAGFQGTSLPIDLIRKNWRRESDNPVKLASSMVIALDIVIEEKLLETSSCEDFFGGELRVTYTFADNSARPGWVDKPGEFWEDCLYDLRIDFNGELLLVLSDHLSATINCNNPYLNRIPSVRDKCKFTSLLMKASDCGRAVDFSSLPQILVEGDLVKLDCPVTHEFIGLGLKIINVHGWQKETEWDKSAAQFKSCFDAILKSVTLELPQASTRIVNASRQVPRPDELVYLIKDIEQANTFFDHAPFKSGLPEMAALARSYACTKTNFDLMEPDDLIERVNHSLTDDLFAERGYRLGFDHRSLISPSGESDGIFVRIFLVDSSGRSFNFTEVGSGLGYILPVLVAIWDDSEWGYSYLINRIIIQQPELHLHPALQSSLGDVFINASNTVSPNELVIETHSEHLLMRILRRIRESADGRCPEGYNLSADDVSVLYFNPSPEGSTRVTRLRIGDDGRFLDPWPRGFFDDNLGDLF
jgi:hypothetical protein